MPKVETAQQRVRQQAFTSSFRQAPSSAGFTNLGRSIQQAGSELAAIQNFEQDKTNKSSVMQADTAVTKAFNDSFFSEDGYRNKHGEDAFNKAAQDDYHTQLEKIGREQMDQLANQEQRDMFERVLKARTERAGNLGRNHAIEQKDVWINNNSKARVEAAYESATLDYSLDNIALNRGLIMEEIKTTMEGQSPETTKNAMKEADSTLFLSVAQSMIENGNTDGAEDLIKGAKNVDGDPVLKTDDRKTFNDLLEFTNQKQKAQGIMGDVYVEGGDIADMVAEGRKLAGDDVALGDEIQRRLINRNNLEINARNQMALDMHDQLAKKIGNVGSGFKVKDITPEELGLMGPKEIESLKRTEELAAAKRLRETDPISWVEVTSMSPDQLVNVDPMDYREKLNDGHWNQLVNMIGGAKGGVVKPEDFNVITEAAQYKNIAGRLGYLDKDASEETQLKAQKLLYRYTSRKAQFIEQNKREPVGNEVTDIYNDLTTEIIRDDAGFSGYFTNLFKDDKKVFEVDNEVPQDKFDEVRSAVIADGLQPTIININKYYNAALSRME